MTCLARMNYNPATPECLVGRAVLMKIVIVLFLLIILYTLASSLWFLVRDSGEGTDVVKRLSWRIGLSIALFVFLWIAYQLGWIEPNSGPIRMPPPQTQNPG